MSADTDIPVSSVQVKPGSMTTPKPPEGGKRTSMVLHKSDNRKWGNDCMSYRTLCRRTNRQSRDGMNVADTDAQVTCKFCLKKMAGR